MNIFNRTLIWILNICLRIYKKLLIWLPFLLYFFHYLIYFMTKNILKQVGFACKTKSGQFLFWWWLACVQCYSTTCQLLLNSEVIFLCLTSDLVSMHQKSWVSSAWRNADRELRANRWLNAGLKSRDTLKLALPLPN